MATYIFHRLTKKKHIMGKVKIDNFFFLNQDIWNLFIQKCILSSPLSFIYLLSNSLNLIGCQGNIKALQACIIPRHEISIQ